MFIFLCFLTDSSKEQTTCNENTCPHLTPTFVQFISPFTNHLSICLVGRHAEISYSKLHKYKYKLKTKIHTSKFSVKLFPYYNIFPEQKNRKKIMSLSSVAYIKTSSYYVTPSQHSSYFLLNEQTFVRRIKRNGNSKKRKQKMYK